MWACGKGGARRAFSWARYQELLQAGGAPPVPVENRRAGVRVAAILRCAPAEDGCG